jgi:hypothetical protein
LLFTPFIHHVTPSFPAAKYSTAGDKPTFCSGKALKTHHHKNHHLLTFTFSLPKTKPRFDSSY